MLMPTNSDNHVFETGRGLLAVAGLIGAVAASVLLHPAPGFVRVGRERRLDRQSHATGALSALLYRRDARLHRGWLLAVLPVLEHGLHRR